MRNWDKRVNTPQTPSTARVCRHREKSRRRLETDETFQERSCNALEQNRTDTEQIKEHPSPRKRGAVRCLGDRVAFGLTWWIGKAGLQTAKARKKPITEEGARRQLKQLADYRADGHQPADVIANSIAGGLPKGYSRRADKFEQARHPGRSQWRTGMQNLVKCWPRAAARP